MSDTPEALSLQVGGNHYKRYKIQPIEFATLNRLPPCIFSSIKYLMRHRAKGKAEDLKKAIHFLQL